MGLYIEVQYRGDWWGDDPLTETRHETTGDLFRALAGKDSRYPWESLGRCAGKVYIDDADGPRQVGWIFVARNPEPVNRGDEQPTGLREAWVTVHDAPATVVRTEHYATFGKATSVPAERMQGGRDDDGNPSIIGSAFAHDFGQMCSCVDCAGPVLDPLTR